MEITIDGECRCCSEPEYKALTFKDDERCNELYMTVMIGTEKIRVLRREVYNAIMAFKDTGV